MAKNKTKKKNLPPGITPKTIQKDFKEFLAGMVAEPRLILLNYEQMKGICNGFASHLMNVVKEGSNPFEQERLGHASSELFDLLKDKYNIPALDSAALLIACGVELLNRCDIEIDKARRNEQGI